MKKSSKKYVLWVLLFIILFTKLGFTDVLKVKVSNGINQVNNIEELNTSGDELEMRIDSNTAIIDESSIIGFFQQLIETEHTQEWEKYPDFWTDGSDKEYSLFLSDQEFLDNNAGIATVRSAKLLYLAKDTDASRNQDYDIYIAGIDYQVAEVNTFYNGIKFSRFIVKDIDEEFKISEREEVSFAQIEIVDSIGEVLFNLLSEEQMLDAINLAYEVRLARTKGLIVDSDMTVHSKLFEIEESIK